jgi:hypothetical protein
VAISPDGTHLAWGGADQEKNDEPNATGTAWLWEIAPSLWEERASRIAGRNLTRKEWNLVMGPDVPYRQTFPRYPPGE